MFAALAAFLHPTQSGARPVKPCRTQDSWDVYSRTRGWFSRKAPLFIISRPNSIFKSPRPRRDGRDRYPASRVCGPAPTTGTHPVAGRPQHCGIASNLTRLPEERLEGASPGSPRMPRKVAGPRPDRTSGSVEAPATPEGVCDQCHRERRPAGRLAGLKHRGRLLQS